VQADPANPAAPASYKGFALDPFQRRAIEALEAGRSVIVCAPTGAGKTLIGEYAIERAIREGRRLIYTAPIKALNNQKYRDFTAAYPGRIGIKTGDVSMNVDAPILLMTTEIFRNMIFEDPARMADVDYAILDEIHFLDDIERGTVWEECIIFAPPNIKILALSATVPNAEKVADWIRNVRPDTKLEVVFETHRPIPLVQRLWVPGVGDRSLEELERAETSRDALLDRVREDEDWVPKIVRHLRDQSRLPCIFFAFNRKECEALAGEMRFPLLSSEEEAQMLSLYERLCRQFQIDEDETVERLRTLLSFGTCYHHAGLLPTLKEVVERIFTTGLLKILFATETFALGVNMPARSVVFASVFKFDGRRTAMLKVREHHQMAGRAGRRGIDPVGYVYSNVEWPQVPASAVRGLLHGQIEPIRSQFNLSYSTILSLYDHLQERIFQAAEKSLSNFLDDRRRKPVFGERIRRIRSKLNVLRELEYVSGRKLTRKGRFAARIYGYEIPITELYFAGLLESASEPDLCMIMCAVAYEPRRGTYYQRLRDPRLRRLQRDCLRATDRLLRVEERAGLGVESKPMEFQLSAAVRAWAEGWPFERLERMTGADAGDLIRFFRLTIQVLRNAAAAIDEPSLKRRLLNAVRRINRDEVDAERQLRLGTPELAPSNGEAAALEKPGESVDE
jgi:superfamily II RNA helicase